MGILAIQYLVLAAITIFATNQASNYIDELDNKTEYQWCTAWWGPACTCHKSSRTDYDPYFNA